MMPDDFAIGGAGERQAGGGPMEDLEGDEEL
jgi:hypothetical protein